MEIKREETYELMIPIEVGGRRIESVTLRRPIFKEFRAAMAKSKGVEFDAICLLVQSSAQLTDQEMDAMDAGDVFEIMGVYQNFLPRRAASSLK